mmetsp:Transcript_25826/g.72606  ORF Transcript_25826/g.72606 Transcript_25826/m.72606 type:complete len:111 (-) Transcript_25826:18-350(-)
MKEPRAKPPGPGLGKWCLKALSNLCSNSVAIVSESASAGRCLASAQDETLPPVLIPAQSVCRGSPTAAEGRHRIAAREAEGAARSRRAGHDIMAEEDGSSGRGGSGEVVL